MVEIDEEELLEEAALDISGLYGVTSTRVEDGFVTVNVKLERANLNDLASRAWGSHGLRIWKEEYDSENEFVRRLYRPARSG